MANSLEKKRILFVEKYKGTEKSHSKNIVNIFLYTSKMYVLMYSKLNHTIAISLLLFDTSHKRTK